MFISAGPRLSEDNGQGTCLVPSSPVERLLSNRGRVSGPLPLLLLNSQCCALTGPHTLRFLCFKLSSLPQTNRTGASLPDASCWKDKAMNTPSFSTHLRRSQSVSSSQAPTWRGHQGKASDRPGQIPHRFGSAGWVQHPPGPGVSKDLKWGARNFSMLGL